MTTATPIPYRARYRPGFAKLGKPALRGDGDALPPTRSGAYWFRSPAIVMRGWRPCEIEPAKPARSLWTHLSGFAAGVFRCIGAWQERARFRDALLRLDDRTLRDIGLTRLDVNREVNKLFRRGKPTEGTDARASAGDTAHTASSARHSERQADR